MVERKKKRFVRLRDELTVKKNCGFLKAGRNHNV